MVRYIVRIMNSRASCALAMEGIPRVIPVMSHSIYTLSSINSTHCLIFMQSLLSHRHICACLLKTNASTPAERRACNAKVTLTTRSGCCKSSTMQAKTAILIRLPLLCQNQPHVCEPRRLSASPGQLARQRIGQWRSCYSACR